MLNSLGYKERRAMFSQIIGDLGKHFGTSNIKQILAEAHRRHHGSYPSPERLTSDLQHVADYRLPYAVTRIHLDVFGSPEEVTATMLR